MMPVKKKARKTSLAMSVRTYLRCTCIYLLMTLLALFFLFPFVFMLVSSLKDNDAQLMADMGSISAFIPSGHLSLLNYVNVFRLMPFGLYLLNSVFILLCTVSSGLIVNSLIGYALARMQFAGRDFLLTCIVGLMIVPFEAIAIPLLLLVNQLPWVDGSTSWLDSYHVQIIPFIADAFAIYLFYQFFLGIPKEFEEAALVDGAGYFRIYWQLIVPFSRPVFAAAAILQLITHIGDLLWPVMVTRGDTYRPLTVGLQIFFGEPPIRWGPIMAFATMTTLPVLVVFLLFQRWFLNSFASSGIQG